jgi:hypothetical protein
MKLYTEVVEDVRELDIPSKNVEGKIRIQVMEDENGIYYDIYCNDRFKPNDFSAKVYCELCEPKFVPKVIEYDGIKLCSTCLFKLIEALRIATLSDCTRDQKQVENLQKILED